MIDLDRDFALENLSGDARKDAFWSNGEDFLFGLVSMLVLDEVAVENEPLRRLMSSTREGPAFSVKEPNIERALADRIQAGWRLRGDIRQRQREAADLRLKTFRGE